MCPQHGMEPLGDITWRDIYIYIKHIPDFICRPHGKAGLAAWSSYLPTSLPALRSPGHMAPYYVWGSPSHTAAHHAWQRELMEPVAPSHLAAAVHKSFDCLQCLFTSPHQHREWVVPATLWGAEDDVSKTREEFLPSLLSLCPTCIAPAIRMTKIIPWHHLSLIEKHKPGKFPMEIARGNRLSRLSMPRRTSLTGYFSPRHFIRNWSSLNQWFTPHSVLADCILRALG